MILNRYEKILKKNKGKMLKIKNLFINKYK